MATFESRYASGSRFSNKMPHALQSGLKPIVTKRGHINVSRFLNLNLLSSRKRNIASAAKDPVNFGIYSDELSAHGREGAIFGFLQNSLAFTLRVGAGRQSPSAVNSALEQPNIVWSVFNGIKHPRTMTQEQFEGQLQIKGIAMHDYEYGEAGSNIRVSLNGLNTVQMFDTDVYVGDHFC